MPPVIVSPWPRAVLFAQYALSRGIRNFAFDFHEAYIARVTLPRATETRNKRRVQVDHRIYIHKQDTSSLGGFQNRISSATGVKEYTPRATRLRRHTGVNLRKTKILFGVRPEWFESKSVPTLVPEGCVALRGTLVYSTCCYWGGP